MNPCISTPVPSGVDVLFLPDGLGCRSPIPCCFFGAPACVCCLNEQEELPPLPDDASGVLLSFPLPFSTATSPSHWPPAAESKRMIGRIWFCAVGYFTDRGGAFDPARIPLSASLAQRMREDLAPLIFDLALTRKDRRWSKCRSRRYLTVILESLHHCYELQYPPSSRPAASSPAVLDILMYIHAHFDEELSLERLSSEFHLGKSALCRRFKMATGRSVGQYILSYRLSVRQIFPGYHRPCLCRRSPISAVFQAALPSATVSAPATAASRTIPGGKTQARRRDFGGPCAESQWILCYTLYI